MAKGRTGWEHGSFLANATSLCGCEIGVEGSVGILLQTLMLVAVCQHRPLGSYVKGLGERCPGGDFGRQLDRFKMNGVGCPGDDLHDMMFLCTELSSSSPRFRLGNDVAFVPLSEPASK